MDTNVDDAKVMARRLRAALARRDVVISHGAALELVAAELGFDSWNVAAARHNDAIPVVLPEAPVEARVADPIRLRRGIPVLRILDEERARGFYLDYLGFRVGSEHRFAPDLPIYMEVSRLGFALHLSGHHGDAMPGATVFVPTQGVRSLHRELTDKRHGFSRPAIEQQPWGDQLTVTDPFGNRLRFCERRRGAD